MKEEEENNKQNSQSPGAYKARKTWTHNLFTENNYSVHTLL